MSALVNVKFFIQKYRIDFILAVLLFAFMMFYILKTFTVVISIISKKTVKSLSQERQKNTSTSILKNKLLESPKPVKRCIGKNNKRYSTNATSSINTNKPLHEVSYTELSNELKNLLKGGNIVSESEDDEINKTGGWNFLPENLSFSTHLVSKSYKDIIIKAQKMQKNGWPDVDWKDLAEILHIHFGNITEKQKGIDDLTDEFLNNEEINGTSQEIYQLIDKFQKTKLFVRENSKRNLHAQVKNILQDLEKEHGTLQDAVTNQSPSLKKHIFMQFENYPESDKYYWDFAKHKKVFYDTFPNWSGNWFYLTDADLWIRAPHPYEVPLGPDLWVYDFDIEYWVKLRRLTLQEKEKMSASVKNTNKNKNLDWEYRGRNA